MSYFCQLKIVMYSLVISFDIGNFPVTSCLVQ